jgi:hypothetical protein
VEQRHAGEVGQGRPLGHLEQAPDVVVRLHAVDQVRGLVPDEAVALPREEQSVRGQERRQGQQQQGSVAELLPFEAK